MRNIPRYLRFRRPETGGGYRKEFLGIKKFERYVVDVMLLVTSYETLGLGIVQP